MSSKHELQNVFERMRQNRDRDVKGESMEGELQGRSSSGSGTGTGEWLVTVATIGDAKVKKLRSGGCRPRIQRVTDLLRRAEKNDGRLFSPEVVAIGPYHHGKPELSGMEEHKQAAALRFASGSGSDMKDFYAEVLRVSSEARRCYDTVDLPLPELGEEEFAAMMFFDGCFLLHFMELFEGGRSGELSMNSHLHGFVVKDMFLLENQVPFVVLEALMRLKPVRIDEFIASNIIGDKRTARREWCGGNGGAPPPLHLLDLLRTMMLGERREQVEHERGNELHKFRSVKELREAGIVFRRGRSPFLRDVEYRQGWINGHIGLPPIIVDDLTRSRLLNLIALEACPDGGDAGGAGVASYVWLMDCLVDSAGDARALRRKGILHNSLGSDEQVAELFNEIATGVSPEAGAYATALRGVAGHYGSRWRVHVSTLLYTRFRSPWAGISFVAAILLLVLNFVQALFSIINPPGKS